MSQPDQRDAAREGLAEAIMRAVASWVDLDLLPSGALELADSLLAQGYVKRNSSDAQIIERQKVQLEQRWIAMEELRAAGAEQGLRRIRDLERDLAQSRAKIESALEGLLQGDQTAQGRWAAAFAALAGDRCFTASPVSPDVIKIKDPDLANRLNRARSAFELGLRDQLRHDLLNQGMATLIDGHLAVLNDTGEVIDLMAGTTCEPGPSIRGCTCGCPETEPGAHRVRCGIFLDLDQPADDPAENGER